jgi:hypothetical protein
MHIPLALALLAMAQDKAPELKDNPIYLYWSSCKAGSWVKVSMQVDQRGQKMDMEQVQKLLEVKEDKAVVEVSGKMKMAAGEFPIPVQKQDIKAKEPPEKVKIDKEGDEEIDVAGKKLQCHWYELSITGGTPMKLKVWMSKDIPGGTARAEMTPEGQKTIIMNTLEWEKK